MITKKEAHWSTCLLGIPWVAGGRDPLVGYDCWGLVLDIYKGILGIELKEYPFVDPRKLKQCADVIDSEASSCWDNLKKPLDMCVVAMSRTQKLHHVGVYMERDGGLVVHSDESSGVIIESINDLKRAGWNRIEFYGHRH